MRLVEFRRRAMECVVLYASNGEGYVPAMDQMAQDCTEWQWRALIAYLRAADETMVDGEVGTLYQRERVKAKREGRPSRFPSLFTLTDPGDRDIEVVRALQQELGGELPDWAQ